MTNMGSPSASATTLEQYCYEPIRRHQIRLFLMEPSANFDSEILGRLRAVELMVYSVALDRSAAADGSFLHYTALSYAWGRTYEDNSHLTENIVYDGRRLSVTPNLKQGLRRMRELAYRGK